MELFSPIPLDCRRHEALLRIVASIDAVDRLTARVCSAVDERVAAVQRRVEAIEQRQIVVAEAIKVTDCENTVDAF